MYVPTTINGQYKENFKEDHITWLSQFFALGLMSFMIHVYVPTAYFILQYIDLPFYNITDT